MLCILRVLKREERENFKRVDRDGCFIQFPFADQTASGYSMLNVATVAFRQ